MELTIERQHLEHEVIDGKLVFRITRREKVNLNTLAENNDYLDSLIQVGLERFFIKKSREINKASLNARFK